MELAGQVMRRPRVFGAGEAHAVPGRVVGAEAEFAEARRHREGPGGGIPSSGQTLEGRQIEAGLGRGGGRGGCQRCQRAEDVERETPRARCGSVTAER